MAVSLWGLNLLFSCRLDYTWKRCWPLLVETLQEWKSACKPMSCVTCRLAGSHAKRLLMYCCISTASRHAASQRRHRVFKYGHDPTPQHYKRSTMLIQLGDLWLHRALTVSPIWVSNPCQDIRRTCMEVRRKCTSAQCVTQSWHGLTIFGGTWCFVTVTRKHTDTTQNMAGRDYSHPNQENLNFNVPA